MQLKHAQRMHMPRHLRNGVVSMLAQVCTLHVQRCELGERNARLQHRAAVLCQGLSQLIDVVDAERPHRRELAELVSQPWHGVCINSAAVIWPLLIPLRVCVRHTQRELSDAVPVDRRVGTARSELLYRMTGTSTVMQQVSLRNIAARAQAAAKLFKKPNASSWMSPDT
jgi:hypothetical protein